MVYFTSDYCEGCHEQILKALIETNMEQTPGYGTDHHCANAARLIKADCGREDVDVHFLEGGFRRGIVLEAYEAESSRSPGLTVGAAACVRDLSEARERFLKALIGGFPCEPAYKQFLRHHQDSVKTPRRPSFGTPHSTRC